MSMPGGINSHQLKWFQNVSKNSIKIIKGCGTVAAMCTVLHICPFCWWFRPTDQYFVPREIALLQDHPALNTYGCSTQLCIQSWSHKLKVPACSLSSTQFLETRRIWLRYVKVCWMLRPNRIQGVRTWGGLWLDMHIILGHMCASPPKICLSSPTHLHTRNWYCSHGRGRGYSAIRLFDQAKFQLAADGVPENDITVSGIPQSWHVWSRNVFTFYSYALISLA